MSVDWAREASMDSATASLDKAPNRCLAEERGRSHAAVRSLRSVRISARSRDSEAGDAHHALSLVAGGGEADFEPLQPRRASRVRGLPRSVRPGW